MRQFTFIIIISLLIQAKVFCQEEFYYYGKFKQGCTTLIFGDNVNIRESASANSKVIDQLIIGTSVKILEQSEETLTLNNYKEAWYKIQYNNTKTGYIWGGLLAKGYVIKEVSAKYPGKEKIIFGMKSMIAYSKIAEVRYCSSKGEIISSIEYNSLALSFGKEDNTFGYSASASYFGDKGFDPPVEFFTINYSYEACDYPNGSEYIYILDDKLHYAFYSAWSSNEIGSAHPSLTFPNDVGGEHNVINEVTEYTERDENYDTEETWQSLTKYIWSGKKFYKIEKQRIE